MRNMPTEMVVGLVVEESLQDSSIEFVQMCEHPENFVAVAPVVEVQFDKHTLFVEEDRWCFVCSLDLVHFFLHDPQVVFSHQI